MAGGPDRFDDVKFPRRSAGSAGSVGGGLAARASRTREVLFGSPQRGGKFRLPLSEERAHVGTVLPGPLGFRQ